MTNTIPGVLIDKERTCEAPEFMRWARTQVHEAPDSMKWGITETRQWFEGCAIPQDQPSITTRISPQVAEGILKLTGKPAGDFAENYDGYFFDKEGNPTGYFF